MTRILDKFRIFLLVLIDLALVNSAFYLAYVIRWEGKIPEHMFEAYLSLIPWVSGGKIIFFSVFNLYRWSFRYASLNEAINIFKAVGSSSSAFMLFVLLSDYRRLVGRSVPLIDFLLCLFFMLAFRFVFRFIIQFEFLSDKYSSLPRVLIVGAGMSGESVARELVGISDKKYYPVGFIDDDPRKKHLSIHGIKVLGNASEISRIIRSHKVDEIIIAIPSANGQTIRSIISSCRTSNVTFKIIPGLHKILSGKVELKKIRNVSPEDLLGRETVSINNSEVSSYLSGRRVIITGAGGSIGSELVRQTAAYNPAALILLDHNENDMFFLENEIRKKFPDLDLHACIGDITDVGFIKHVFSGLKPEVVFHAAAHKHVPLMEVNPSAAVKNNIGGTRNMIYASEHYRVSRFVMISTDKAVNPTSVMGASKRVTELLCQAKARSSRTQFMAVRFGNVMGSNGSAVQLFKKQIEEGGPVTVTHPDIRRYFMTVGEAVQLVLQAGAMGGGGEIFILDMGEQVNITELARNLITLSGLELDNDISIKFTGLRPGEKLYEEVLHDSENDLATRHDKIFISKSDETDFKKLKQDIRRLIYLAKMNDNAGIIAKLTDMLPNYKPARQNMP